MTTDSFHTLLAALDGLDDRQLSGLIQQAQALQQGRAVAAADPDALTELGFAEGFKANGLPTDPWIESGILVCPGGQVGASRTAHTCGFVSVDGVWVWDAADTLVDTVRTVAAPKPAMRSVSLLPVFDGLNFDLVVSKFRAGRHTMQSVRSFEIRDSTIHLTQTRAKAPTATHR